MASVLHDLIALLSLERLEGDRFVGQSQDLGWGSLYGGHVLGQALSAAAQTVPSARAPHSLHAYFLETGSVSDPITYEVERTRDGGSFTTRRVMALQRGQRIFMMACSFHKEEPGDRHQDAMPAAPAPESLPTERELHASYGARLPESLRRRGERAFEMRLVDPPRDLIQPAPSPPRRLVWVRAVDRLPDDPALHLCLWAYASDYMLLTTALLPHGVGVFTPGMQVTSLDHALWLHRPLRMDEWHLYAMQSPIAHAARGLALGQLFTRDGNLVASIAQEGLMRRR